MTLAACRGSYNTNANPNFISEKINGKELEQRLFTPPDERSLQELLDEWLEKQPHGMVLADTPGKGPIYAPIDIKDIGTPIYFEDDLTRGYIDMFNGHGALKLEQVADPRLPILNEITRLDDHRRPNYRKLSEGMAMLISKDPGTFWIVSDLAGAGLEIKDSVSKIDEDFKKWIKSGGPGVKVNVISATDNYNINTITYDPMEILKPTRWNVGLGLDEITLINDMRGFDMVFNADAKIRIRARTGYGSFKFSNLDSLTENRGQSLIFEFVLSH